ncbi:hypothetical protein HGM15179_011103 [Zosterops borbonicus]|uniref:U4/U6.U5 small nuclear ribonucleoprotein 27 kDa protein n=1 Tax=Zosterops borbonicus TaxID=364589 RepID=A0A8K1GDU0_9PASS|nr:hypothetical protein HGM15179_011103 [Zosterops borbonicus]
MVSWFRNGTPRFNDFTEKSPGAAGTGCAGHQEDSSNFSEKPLLNPPHYRTQAQPQDVRTPGWARRAPAENAPGWHRLCLNLGTRIEAAAPPPDGLVGQNTERCKRSERESTGLHSITGPPSSPPLPAVPFLPAFPSHLGLGGLLGRAAGADRSPRRHRSSSSSPARPKERRDEEKKELKDSKKERQITEEDLQGKTEEEIEMMKMMGFASFDTTKGKKVDGAANAYAINVSQKRKYRQYMNRKGGFNRPLDFIA